MFPFIRRYLWGDFMNSQFMLFSQPSKKEQEGVIYDVLIVGGGPAGLTAGLYASRLGLKTILITQTVGGLAATAHVIENYPGFIEISGPELTNKMYEQAVKWGTNVHISESVVDIKNAHAEIKDIISDRQTYKAKTVIIATGADHKKLGVPGEKEFEGRGVSYCATCDGAFFKNKVVAIVGGSNTAATDGLFLTQLVKKLYIIHRRDKMRAEPVLAKRLLSQKNVEPIWNTVVKEIKGGTSVKKLILENIKDKSIKELDVDGVFIAIGIVPNNELAKKIGIELDSSGYIKTNKRQETNIQGIYACGDITGGIGQITIAVGEGTIAALSAYQYIKGGAYGTY